MLDILQYAEKLDYPLFPAQQTILKSLYHLPMTPEETAWFDGLRQEGRYAHQGSDIPRFAVWAMGRRSGKDHMGELILAYEVYAAVQDDDFSTTHPEAPSSVSFAYVSCDLEQAKYHGTNVHSLLCRMDATRDCLKQSSARQMRFVTPKGRTLTVHFLSSNMKSLRGPSHLVVVGSEVDFWSNDERTYSALFPSMLASPHAKLLLVSSRSGKHGLFHRKFKALQEGSVNGVLLQLATWEVNPQIPQDAFNLERERHPQFFDREYGAVSDGDEDDA